MDAARDLPTGFDVAALMAPSLRRLGWLAAIIAYLWALPEMAFIRPFPHWPGILGPLALLCAGLLSVRRTSGYRASALTLVAGLLVTLGLELAAGHVHSVGIVSLAAVLVSGMTLGTVFGVGVAVALCLSLPLAQVALPEVMPQALLVPTWREAALGGLLLWTVGNNVFRSLQQAEASELRSWRQAREAQERQAELHRTTKALRDMYAALERTNRELEAARREAEEAKEAKARFAANISHELRTPLNLILGFSRLMYQAPEVYGALSWPAEFRLDIHEIYRASRHLLEMIDDILDLSRLQAQRLPLKPVLTQLEPVIEDAAATARGLLRGSSVALVVDLPPDLPVVEMDPTRIRQVLLNLLNNAVRFTDQGEIRVGAKLLPGEVEVSVTDTGVGIPPTELSSIFELFTQVTERGGSGRGGAGLGLAVCKHFVELHGGRISAHSVVGEGSTFSFVLPLPDSGRARSRLSYYAPEGWTAPLPPDRTGPALLVMATDMPTAQAVARGLTGFRTLPIVEGQLTAELVRTEHPSALVIARDPLRPQEGPTLEQLWQAAGRSDLPLIECEVPTETSARHALGVDAYLTKPVQMEELLSAIQAILPQTTLAAASSGPGPDGETTAPRFLIVDDAPGFRTLMNRELLRAYPEAYVAQRASGEEGLELLHQEEFDLLLLDLVMPDGGGLDLLHRARKEGLLSSTGVIVTTGAPYIEELTALFPTRIRYGTRTPPRSRDWFRCIEALASAAAPDYTVSEPTGPVS